MSPFSFWQRIHTLAPSELLNVQIGQSQEAIRGRAKASNQVRPPTPVTRLIHMGAKTTNCLKSREIQKYSFPLLYESSPPCKPTRSDTK